MERSNVMMFCKGDSVEIAGYPCDYIHCNVADRPMYQEQGYVDHPAELYEDEQEEAEEELIEKLRAEAKEKGISSWHVKGVDTLKKELGYDD